MLDVNTITQVSVFAGLMSLLGYLTWRQVASGRRQASGDSAKEIFLAGGNLSWIFVAGAITLTNLSTEQLVGMNGSQMLLLAWWELFGFVGLLLLGFVFVPIYYRNNCTTVTELLERKYNRGSSIRTMISFLFLVGNLFIYLPTAIYGGAIFMQSLFGLEIPIIAIASFIAILGAAYAILGGLRAVAVLDTYSGVGILSLAMVVVVMALWAVDFDIVTDVPVSRLTLIGDNNSDIPFHTLFTGMIFIQIFYWSTNQNITQKALAAPTVREAQKGIVVAAIIRVLVIPPIVVVPGVVAFKLFGDVDDAAYGMVVKEVLPPWTSGLFAAMVVAAVITTYSAVLNATITLYAVDFHRKFFNRDANVARLNVICGVMAMLISISLVPIYAEAESLIDTIQKLNGLLSMPILSAFVTALLFRNVDARAAVAGLVYGFAIYAFHTFVLDQSNWTEGKDNFYEMIGLPWIHYIDVNLFVLVSSVLVGLAVNFLVFGGQNRSNDSSESAD